MHVQCIPLINCRLKVNFEKFLPTKAVRRSRQNCGERFVMRKYIFDKTLSSFLFLRKAWA
jgi:hypothetical protein